MCRRFSLFGVRMVCSYLFIRSSCRRFYAAKTKKREGVEVGFAWILTFSGSKVILEKD